MDVCLGLGLGDTMVTLMQKMSDSGSVMEPEVVDSPRGSNFSWSFVNRSAGQSSSAKACDASVAIPRNSADFASEASFCSSPSASAASGLSSDGKSSSSTSSVKSSSSRSHSIRSLFGLGKSRARKPAVLEKVPFGKWSKYLTVCVGSRTGETEKYVINRSLLAHPLIQVLIKCSEDEFDEDYSSKSKIHIACDPALFLEVVRLVDDTMCSAQDVHADECEESHEEDI